MNVRDLIKKLVAIDDKDIKLLFFCENCGHHVPVTEMKNFGFIRSESLEPSPLMKRLKEIMPKKPDPPESKDWKMSPFQLDPIRRHAETFTAWIGDDLPQDHRELAALLWVFGEIMNGDMERRLNHAFKTAESLSKLIMIPEEKSGNQS